MGQAVQQEAGQLDFWRWDG